MSELSKQLRAIGISGNDLPNGFVVLPSFPIHLGRHKGEVVAVALTNVDFPMTPPAGLHINAPWGSDRQNVTPSPLGDDWKYFSRRLSSWKGGNAIHSVLAYINRVLADA